MLKPSNDQDEEPLANFDGIGRCRELVEDLRTKLCLEITSNTSPNMDIREIPLVMEEAMPDEPEAVVKGVERPDQRLREPIFRGRTGDRPHGSLML